MNRIRPTCSNPTVRHARWGASSAVLIALGSAATLFGSLCMGLTVATASEESPAAVSAVAEARPVAPASPSARAARDEAAPAIAFVPQYSDAVRRLADAPARSDSAAPSSPYPAQAGLSR